MIYKCWLQLLIVLFMGGPGTVVGSVSCAGRNTHKPRITHHSWATPGQEHVGMAELIELVVDSTFIRSRIVPQTLQGNHGV